MIKWMMIGALIRAAPTIMVTGWRNNDPIVSRLAFDCFDPSVVAQLDPFAPSSALSVLRGRGSQESLDRTGHIITNQAGTPPHFFLVVPLRVEWDERYCFCSHPVGWELPCLVFAPAVGPWDVWGWSVFTGVSPWRFSSASYQRVPLGHSLEEEAGQHRIEIIAGSDQVVLHADACAASTHFRQIFFQDFQVAVP